MPGKVIQSLRKVKYKNPLLLFDEIDKMTYGVMGDPAAALLEVLDPEQNHTFMDHYLEVEFDISDVLFFCTANVAHNIPPALKDRMEVITLTGYTELEKDHIAREHLLPKQMDENGLTVKKIQFQQKAILDIIRSYTREAGVRNLEREIGKTCRKVATQLVKKKKLNKVVVTSSRVEKFLGVPRYKHAKAEEQNEIGTTCGLAWTQAGGELLVTEVNLMKGTGKLQLTGKLGDVMKESAQAALSFVRTNANRLGIFSSIFEKTDIHIHVPAGAVPKDGPSAGVTIATSLVSAFTSIPVRSEVAMTGETTLRGKVLAIGGLKEKLLAAKRGVISTVIIPYKNKKDLSEIPEEIQNGLEIIPINTVEEVLNISLERFPSPVIDPVSDDVEGSKESTEATILPETKSSDSPRTYDA
jgi:ATP-dependent Lon protease